MFKKCLEIGCHYTNTLADYDCFSESKITMVDPIQEFLDKVPDNARICKLNYAVTDDYDGKQTFYELPTDVQEQNNLPQWATTMGSLLPDHATIAHFGWQQYINQISVQCISLEKLFSEYSLADIDFLQTDTEGYDYKLLVKLHTLGITPDVIKFESKLMSSDQLDYIVQTYKSKGYTHKHGMQKDFNGNSYNTILTKVDNLALEILL